jgi:ribosomal protein S3AE
MKIILKKTYLAAIKKTIIEIWVEELKTEPIKKYEHKLISDRLDHIENKELAKIINQVIRGFPTKINKDEFCHVWFNLMALDILDKENLQRVPYEEAELMVNELMAVDIRVIKEILLNEWTKELEVGII